MSGIAIVTGGSRGIGAATARLLARRGYDVAISWLSDEKAAESVVADIKSAGRRGLAIRADAAAEADTERLFKTVDEKLGVPNALVNNAGFTGLAGRLDDAPADTIRRVIDANLLGAIWGCRAAVRRMSTKFGGRGGGIVNISSVAAELGSPNMYVWYAAAKGGVDSLTVGLAREVAAEGVRVNAVAPGVIDTDIHDHSGLAGRAGQAASLVPAGRAGRPEEIAEAVAWLLSDAASYVTGDILRVAGGR